MKKEVVLEYWDGEKWIHCSYWLSENLAWTSLGGDNINYRTRLINGEVLTDKSIK